jgi:tRNA(Met) C34 N-acetyltransferase TmcA
VLLTFFSDSAMLLAMTTLRQTGSGMITARAYRGRPKSDFLSIGHGAGISEINPSSTWLTSGR